MKPIVESLKRLYLSGNLTEQKIIELCVKCTINEIEKDYILGNEDK